jgi:hypothetical protein
VEPIGRSIGGCVEFFPRAVFFPTVQANTGPTGFTLWVSRRVLSKEVSFVPWLHLFRCGKALEVFWVFGEFLDKICLTGLPNRNDRFPLPA